MVPSGQVADGLMLFAAFFHEAEFYLVADGNNRAQRPSQII